MVLRLRLLAAMGVVLASCVPVAPIQASGLTLKDGQVVVVSYLCADERVVSVSLKEYPDVEEDAVSVTGKGRPLWRLKGRTVENGVVYFSPSVAPEGLEADPAPAPAPDMSAEVFVAAVIKLEDGTVTEALAPTSQLREGLIDDSSGELITEAQFRDRYDDEC